MPSSSAICLSVATLPVLASIALTDKEKKVILLYYYEEMTLKEISMTLEVSESRVSQLHTKALGKMKNKMGDYMDVFAG